MDMCRICLSTLANRDISDLKLRKQEVQRSPTNIILFCLGIEIEEDSKITRKLCIKCFRKVICFYKFKTLALKNNDRLKSLALDIKQEVITGNSYDVDVFNGNECDESNGSDCLKDVKDEPEVKLVNKNSTASDNELLSSIKSLNDEKLDVIDDISKENKNGIVKENNVVSKRKRACPKVIKNEKPKIRNIVICDECGKSVSDIKEHKKQHLPEDKQDKVQCQVCDKKFKSRRARRKHFRTKHLGLKPHCNICNKDVSSLKTHQLMVHNPDKLPFPCSVCDRRFISPSARDEHALTHSKDRPFDCDVCCKSYRSKLSLTLHKRQVHNKEKNHMCQVCSKLFFMKERLKLHLRSHTKEKPHKCEECGNKFKYVQTLREHKKLHSKSQDFFCDHCSSSFSTKANLARHIKCHTKEKPYPCQYCGVRFARSDHRNRHQITAHEKHRPSVKDELTKKISMKPILVLISEERPG